MGCPAPLGLLEGCWALLGLLEGLFGIAWLARGLLGTTWLALLSRCRGLSYCYDQSANASVQCVNARAWSHVCTSRHVQLYACISMQISSANEIGSKKGPGTLPCRLVRHFHFLLVLVASLWELPFASLLLRGRVHICMSIVRVRACLSLGDSIPLGMGVCQTRLFPAMPARLSQIAQHFQAPPEV